MGVPMSKISEPNDNQLDDRPELLDIHIQRSKCCRSTTICEEGRYWKFIFNGALLHTWRGYHHTRFPYYPGMIRFFSSR